MRIFVRRLCVSLLTGFLAPLLAVVFIIGTEGAVPDAPSFEGGLLLFGPFTLAGSLLVVWPAYALQARTSARLIGVAAVLGVSVAAGFVMLWPWSSGQWFLPSIGAIFGLGTAILWIAIELTMGALTGAGKKGFGLG